MTVKRLPNILLTNYFLVNINPIHLNDGFVGIHLTVLRGLIYDFCDRASLTTATTDNNIVITDAADIFLQSRIPVSHLYWVDIIKIFHINTSEKEVGERERTRTSDDHR